ncbi:MAG TPA: ABC transporter permease [Gemmatimonadaceae bacterium]|nr:ABC transporter permease [Gemmatimonadaceae bacterium]
MTLRELWLRLSYPLRQRRLERELHDEMALHIALRAEDIERQGISPDAAMIAARKRFGNRSRIAASAREAWGWHWLDGLGDDLRYVARQLAHTPAFVLFACLTIALGVALNATAFTFYDAVVLKPLAVTDPGHLIRVWQDTRAFGAEVLPFAAFNVLRRDAHAVQSIVTTTAPQNFAGVLPGHASDDARVVSGRFASSDFFRALGVRAALGRAFDAGDDHAIVLDHGFWTRAFDADPGVIGRRLMIDGVDLTIVGVAPEEFAGTGLPAAAPDFWGPIAVLPALLPNADWRNDGRAHWQVLGRLAPGATLTQVNAELALLARSIRDSAGKAVSLVAKRATFFQTDGGGEFEVFQQVSVAFLAALALILGIAIVNLVNLFAARNAAREREVIVRLALGASRARVARQLVAESALVAILGGALGLVVAHSAAVWLRNWIVTTMARISGGIVGVFLDVGVDWRVIVYTTLLLLIIGVTVGLWPAVRAARGDVNSVLRQGTTSTASALAWSRRNVLLATQVAASLVLLSAAGMLLSGLRLAREIDPGFDADHMLVVDVQDVAAGAERAVRRAEIGRRLSALPEVRAVAWTQRVPFGGTHLRPVATAGAPITISIDNVTEAYFDVMGMSILRGRGFTRQDVETNAPVMIVSASMARLRWPMGDAVGKSVPANDVLSGPDTTRSYTVIGIVHDIRSNFLSRVNGPSTYYPLGLDGPFGAFIVRTRGAPAAATNDVRLAVAGVSPLLMGRTHVLTMQDGPMSLQRLMAQAPAMIALALSLVGLTLAAVGVYGLIAQIVTRRTREIGIHMAIGARPAQVIGRVARKTLRPVLWGALVGGALALGLAFFLRALIAMPDVPDLTFGGGAFNPLVFLGVLVALALVVVAACIVPARRAAMVDPTIALRAE